MSEHEYGNRDNIIKAMQHTHNNILIDAAPVLNETNPLLVDIPVLPSTDTTSHYGTRDASLPTPQIIKIGEGWTSSDYEVTPYRDAISLFVDRSRIPKHVLDIQPNKEQYRRNKDKRHAEGFTQGCCNHLIYGTAAADPEKYDGLAARYATLSNYGVYNCGGSGSYLRSAWLMQFGEEYVSLRHPLNDPHKGIKTMDMGLLKYYLAAVSDDNPAAVSKERYDWTTEFEWKHGLTVGDIRSCKRICNIPKDVSVSAAQNLVTKIIEAINDFKTAGQKFLYLDTKVYTIFDLLTVDKMNVRYSSDNPYGREMMMIRDVMLRKCDALDKDETALTT